MYLINPPTALGGWGNKDTVTFNMALLLKTFWWAVSIKGLWKQVICVKNMQNREFIMWLCNAALDSSHVSYCWNILLSTKHWFYGNLRWAVGSGSTPAIGLDSLSCMIGSHILSYDLIICLKKMGLYVISQLF